MQIEANRLRPAECKSYFVVITFPEKRSSFFRYESTALKRYARQWQQSPLMISGVFDFAFDFAALLS